MWYIDGGFLVWIIPLTYLSRESIIWACTTSFVHTCIYRLFNIFIACLYVPMLFILPSVHVFRFRLIDIHDLRRSFNFLYVTCRCLYLYAWTTSPDHAHVWLPDMHATWLYHMYSRLHLTTLDSHVEILESGPWSLAVPDQSGAAEVWINSCLSGPFFFQPLLDRLARFSSYYSWVLSCISYCTSCFCASWQYLALW